MRADGSFEGLMARLKAGDEEAARRVFQRFANRLVALAHAQLDTLIRQKVGPDDVVQSVFRSFFGRQAAGQFELTGWDGLWGLLVVITLRKCAGKVRHFYGPAHDARREAAAPADSSAPAREPLDRQPTPEEAAVLAETLGQLMSNLDERNRQVLELRLQGYTVPEISAKVERTEYAIEGILKRIRKRLQRLQESDEDAP